MHELGLAQKIIEIAKEEAKRSAIEAPKIRKVVVSAGRLHAIMPESLEFHFDILKKDDPILSAAALEIVVVPLTAECKTCRTIAEQEDAIFLCPKCGGPTEPRSGMELVVEKIVLED